MIEKVILLSIGTIIGCVGMYIRQKIKNLGILEVEKRKSTYKEKKIQYDIIVDTLDNLVDIRTEFLNKLKKAKVRHMILKEIDTYYEELLKKIQIRISKVEACGSDKIIDLLQKLVGSINKEAIMLRKIIDRGCYLQDDFIIHDENDWEYHRKLIIKTIKKELK